MRVFETNERYAEKVNFIDDNNVFVGFDYNGKCCESFGYFLTRTKPIPDVETADADKIEGEDFPGYNFDTAFNEGELYPNHDDCGGSVTFRLANGSDEMFLTLYNHHNGYYGHGWGMRIGGETGTMVVTGDL